MEISALIMAGGKGTRLRPYTDKTPKPLLKIDEKPLIDYVIDYLNKAKIKDIFVAVNNEKEKIKKHLKNMDVRIIETDGPIAYATIQAARVIESPFLSVPSDVIQEPGTIVRLYESFKKANCSAMHHYSKESIVENSIVSYQEFKELINKSAKTGNNFFRTASIYSPNELLSIEKQITASTDGAATLLSETLENAGHKVKCLITSKKYVSINTPEDLINASREISSIVK